MFTTTATTAASSTRTVHRRGMIAMIGGALWALLPVAWTLVSLDDVERGTLSWVAVAVSYWLFGVLPPALLIVGLTALRAALGRAAGRPSATGIALAGVGLAAMAVGNGVEVMSLTFAGEENGAGHAAFLLGFLVSVVAWLILGIVVIRRRGGGLPRAAGWLLALTLPFGIALGFVGELVAPGTDAGFWAAITVPCGVAWVLLGRSLSSVEQPAAR